MTKTISMVVWNEFVNDARVLKEAQTLNNAGYVVTVHALHTPGKTVKREVLEEGLNVYRVSRSPFFAMRKKLAFKKERKPGRILSDSKGNNSSFRQAFKLVTRLWTQFRLMLSIIKAKPSIIHAHDVNVLIIGWLASRIVGAKLIYDAHEISTSREGYRKVRKIVGFIEKKIMPLSDGVITTTDTRAKFFSRAYKVPRPVVLQNRPNITHGLLKTNLIKEQLNLPNDANKIVLYQGGIQAGRGLEKLVEIAEGVDGAYFVFIGGGKLEAKLKEMVREKRIQDKVFFISTVPLNELPKYTASADLGVQPIENTCLNHFSTDSNKLFEYILAGLPVLATNFPEIRKVVEGYEIGKVVEPGVTEIFKEELKKMLADESKLEDYRVNTFKWKKELSWESQERKLIELYKKVQLIY